MTKEIEYEKWYPEVSISFILMFIILKMYFMNTMMIIVILHKLNIGFESLDALRSFVVVIIFLLKVNVFVIMYELLRNPVINMYRWVRYEWLKK